MDNTDKQTKDSKTKKIISIVVIAIAVLVIGGGAGFAIGQYNKNQAVEQAKQDAQQQSQSQPNNGSSDDQQDQNSDRPKHEKAPAKTTTDPTCNADELSLSIASGTEGASAGAATYEVVLENTGDRNCHLGGYPGVSLVNDNGNQIGQPAERVTGQDEPVVQMAPGAGAQATISVPNSANFGAGQCKDGATKLRVYPPNDTGYLSAETDISSWCPGFTVAPVTAM